MEDEENKEIDDLVISLFCHCLNRLQREGKRNNERGDKRERLVRFTDFHPAISHRFLEANGRAHGIKHHELTRHLSRHSRRRQMQE